MKKAIVLAILSAIAFTGHAQSQSTTSAENIGDFHTVEISGRLNVELIPSDETRIEASIFNTEANRFEWSLKSDGTLAARLKPGGGSEANANVKIHFKDLSSIKVIGANAKVTDTLHAKMLDIDLSAGAIFKADVDVKDLRLNAGGNSAAEINGTAKYTEISAGAKSKVNTRLNTVDAWVNAATGAEVFVSATERITINSDTGASVYYRGEPEIMRVNTRLMGTVNNIGK